MNSQGTTRDTRRRPSGGSHPNSRPEPHIHEIRGLVNEVRRSVASDEARRRVLFQLMCVILAVTAGVMTIVNLFTAEYLLGISTASFMIACAIDFALVRHLKSHYNVVYALFAVEEMALLAFFFISGIPQGFSALWVCLIPSFAMLIFGFKPGLALSLLALAMMLFLFWTPVGQGLLQYSYGSTFMLRFPFFYGASLMLSAMVEFVRWETQMQLEHAKDEYEFYYRHDALTGLLNRYGVDELLDGMAMEQGAPDVALIMFDIDNFKRVNDTYGHDFGDAVLKAVSEAPAKVMCEHGHLCRWGGEEFVLLMQCDHDAVEMAEAVRRAIAETQIEHKGESIGVTVSLGVATAAASHVTRDNAYELIDTADEEMYRAKHAGKNRVSIKLNCL